LPLVPLELLLIEPMASGHRSLRLTRAVGWDQFEAYAEALLDMLQGSVLSLADSPVERVWSVRIVGEQYWLSLDDFDLGVCLDSCDAAADARIDALRSILLDRRAQSA
jgi:hypothetical protein